MYKVKLKRYYHCRNLEYVHIYKIEELKVLLEIYF